MGSAQWCFCLQSRWELQGLEGGFVPPHFALDVRGLLYPDRGEKEGAAARRSRLKGHLETSISLVLPPVLALVPEHVLKGVTESVRSATPHSPRVESFISCWVLLVFSLFASMAFCAVAEEAGGEDEAGSEREFTLRFPEIPKGETEETAEPEEGRPATSCSC